MTKSAKPKSGKTSKIAAANAGDRRYGHARALSDLLPGVGRAAFRRYGFVQSAIVSRWPEIVGDRYARVSAPESIRFPHGERTEGVLSLTVASAHVTMMQHIAPEIIERVNRFFGYPAVARVQFRQGTIARPKHRPRPAPTRQVPSELGEGLRTIADPELREVLSALAISVEGPVVNIPHLGKIS